MTRELPAVIALLALALFEAPAAFAQNSGDPLETRLTARAVVVTEGRETFVDAQFARPGDVIEYTATYRNTGRDAITGLQAAMPIPTQTEFIPGSARPAQAKASLDGRVFEDVPLKRAVTLAGKRVEERVPYRDYRYLRWFVGELGGGKTVAVSARVRVIDDGNPNEPGGKGAGK